MANTLSSDTLRAGGPRVRPRLVHTFALVALAAALIGFFTTFLRPVWRGEFHGPPVAYVHAAFVFGWLLMFFMQSRLVHAGRIARHRSLGWLGVALVAGVVLTTPAMGIHALRRDIAAGGGEIAFSSLVGTFTSTAMFLTLFVAALACRRRSEFHRRLMLLAVVVIIWPAFFRFRHYFPGVPRPDIWFGLAPQCAIVLIAMLHDRWTLGRVHPAYWTAGVLVMVEGAFEVTFFDSPGWRVTAHWLAGHVL